MAEISAARDALDSSLSRNEEDTGNSTSETRKLVEISAAAGDAPDLSPSTIKEDAARISTSKTRKPPLISLAMLRRAIGNEIADLNVNEVSRRVYAGVLLKDDKKKEEPENGKDQVQPCTHKYWVDKDLNKSCLMVLAKGLHIVWGDSSEYWTWREEEESCYSVNKKVHIADLVNVCWLEINGKCKTIMLSPRTTYEVTVAIKMSNESQGWQAPVNLSLSLPNGSKQVRSERLDRLEKEKWIPISIGKFETTPKTIGEISFSLMQTEKDWKSGLSIKGLVFTAIA
ncbi:hypothetical protein BT93_J1843 [Corymbia citriodora subsp. variegata]|nr:hypothetical protein BT93_J1843 [Corymbia citriodora subsp. variegata]